MKKRLTIIISISIGAMLVFLIACAPKSAWVETKAIITNIEKLEDNTFSYTIKYDVRKSQAFTKEGKKIIGPVEQHSISAKEPIPQKLRIKYMLEEPIIFEWIDEIQFKP